jgi:hypothetical protein
LAKDVVGIQKKMKEGKFTTNRHNSMRPHQLSCLKLKQNISIDHKNRSWLVVEYALSSDCEHRQHDKYH